VETDFGSPPNADVETLEKYRELRNSWKEGLHNLTAKDVADTVLYVLSTPPNVQIQELIVRAVGEPF